MERRFHYLGSHKVGSVARGHEEAVFSPELFCEAEVADPYRLRVTCLIHVQDITGLQVSMHNLDKNMKCKYEAPCMQQVTLKST